MPLELGSEVRISGAKDFCTIVGKHDGSVTIGQITLDKDEITEYPAVIAAALLEVVKQMPVSKEITT